MLEPNGEITLSHVRATARWYHLQSLPQQFEIPRDYVFPSNKFHTDLLSEITATSQECYVLTASPGMGKSTYLSYLYDSLESNAYPVTRHHYFLSTTDRTVGRLDFLKVAESLMNDISTKYPCSLQGLETNNIGISPLTSPSFYTMIPMLQFLYGVWFIKGGMYTMALSMERLFKELGGIIHYG